MAAAIGEAARGIHKAVRIMKRARCALAALPLGRRLNGRGLAFGVCVWAGARPPLVLRFRFGGCVCLLCVCFVPLVQKNFAVKSPFMKESPVCGVFHFSFTKYLYSTVVDRIPKRRGPSFPPTTRACNAYLRYLWL